MGEAGAAGVDVDFNAGGLIRQGFIAGAAQGDERCGIVPCWRVAAEPHAHKAPGYVFEPSSPPVGSFVGR